MTTDVYACGTAPGGQKVLDRLSRSLLDFARLMAALDGRGVSFVSVTQEFNTTSSLGRLTLHILLSFAQFEREIIGERTRDKLGAARRKGKWIGGIPVLGYDVDPSGGRLVVNAAEAECVREIFRIAAGSGTLASALQELQQPCSSEASRARHAEPEDRQFRVQSMKRKHDRCARALGILFAALLAITTGGRLGQAQTVTLLYSFSKNAPVPEPINPGFAGSIAQGRDGLLYSAGGSGTASHNGGLFSIALSGAFKLVYSFNGTDGQGPESGLTLGPDGYFYGATLGGGTPGSVGTAFKRLRTASSPCFTIFRKPK